MPKLPGRESKTSAVFLRLNMTVLHTIEVGRKWGCMEENRDMVCQQWPVQLRQIHGAGRIYKPGNSATNMYIRESGVNPSFTLEWVREGLWVKLINTSS